MKMNLIRSVLVGAAILAAHNAKAASLEVNISSVAVHTEQSVISAAAETPPGTVTMKVVPYQALNPISPNFANHVRGIMDYYSGHANGPWANATMTDPMSMRFYEDGVLVPHDVMSSTALFWNGTFGPGAPFASEYGTYPYTLVEVTSEGGQVKLSNLRLITASANGNFLGATQTFTSTSYSDLIRGRDVAGNEVRTGVSSSPMRSIVHGGGGAAFRVNTASQYNAVVNHVGGNNNWWTTHTWQYLSDSGEVIASKTFTFNTISRPTLGISYANGTNNVTVVGAASRTFKIFKKADLNSAAAWTLVGTIGGGGTIPIAVVPGESQMFFRAEAQ